VPIGRRRDRWRSSSSERCACRPFGGLVIFSWSRPGLTSGPIVCRPFGSAQGRLYGAGVGWCGLLFFLTQRRHYFIAPRNPYARHEVKIPRGLCRKLLLVPVALGVGMGSFVGRRTPASG
jgi:hypothetical protein